MHKFLIIFLLSSTFALSACNNEEEVPVEPEIEEVETSEEDALEDAIENAESAADAMGKELFDATAPEVAPAPIANSSENETE